MRLLNARGPVPRALGALAGSAGFTIVEYVIAMSIVAVLATAGWVFTESTGRTLKSVSVQADFNQKAGHAAALMLQRIRLANSASNDASGNTLTLSFDDDPNVDSDGDGLPWNDKNHYEEFKFNSGDSSITTLLDNTITYRTSTALADSTVIVPQSVRSLQGQRIFTVTNQSTVLINFGLLDTNNYAESQMIEIRTQARLRNKLQ